MVSDALPVALENLKDKKRYKFHKIFPPAQKPVSTVAREKILLRLLLGEPVAGARLGARLDVTLLGGMLCSMVGYLETWAR